MFAWSSIVKAKFKSLNQSSLLKVKQKQHTSALVEDMTERKKFFPMELKNKGNFFGTQMQHKSTSKKSPG